MSTLDPALGPRLRRLRSAAGLTQQELAAPEYTHAYVSTIEAGKRPPSRAALEHFAAKLEVDVDELATGRPTDLADRLDLQLHEAKRQVASGSAGEAEAAYERILEEATGFDLRHAMAKAMQGLATCAELRGDLDEAISLYERAETALENEPLTVRVDPIAARARCLLIRGQASTAVYILEATLEALEQQNLTDPGALLRLHTSLVAAYFERGAYGKASDSAAEALRLAPQTQDPERLAGMHVNVARVFLDQGRTEDAHESLRRAEEFYRELDLQVDVADCYHSRGYLLSRRGDLAGARRELEQAAEIFREIGSPLKEARSITELARVTRVAGDVGAAQRLLERSLELLGDSESVEVAEAKRELALCTADSDPKLSVEYLSAAADTFKQSGNRVEFAATSRMLGDQLDAMGEHADAVQAYRDGLMAVEENL